MTDNSTPPSDPVRNILRSLPHIPAKEGFELRLERRLRETADGISALPDDRPAWFTFSPVAFSTAAVALFVLVFYGILTVPGLNSVNPAQSDNKTTGQQVVATPTVVPAEHSNISTSPIPNSVPVTISEEKLKPSGSRPKLKQISKSPQSPLANSSAGTSNDSSKMNQPVHSTAASVETTPRALMMNHQESVTGTLELRRTDSTVTRTGKSMKFTPQVKDKFGVGVVGTSISSPLLDSTKSDSLKRLKKQLLQPSASPPKPRN